MARMSTGSRLTVDRAGNARVRKQTLASLTPAELEQLVGRTVYAARALRFKGYTVPAGAATTITRIEDRTAREWDNTQMIGVECFACSPFRQYAGGSIVQASHLTLWW